jgi:hypothetical protein
MRPFRTPGEPWHLRARNSLVGLLACVLQGCGAKTSIWRPCEIEVQPSTPQVVVVVDRSSTAGALCGHIDVERGWHDVACWGHERQMLDQVLPALGADAATGLYVFPEIGVAAMRRDGFCATPSDLLVPIAPHAVGTILSQLHQGDDGTATFWNTPDFWPWGGSPVYAALEVARRALDAAPSPAPRFVVLSSMGISNCNADLTPAECECFNDWGPAASLGPLVCLTDSNNDVRGCSDTRRVVDTIAALRAADIRTMVIVFDPTPSVPPGTAEDRFHVAAAQAGGLAASGTHPWYAMSDSAAIERAFDGQIAPAGWCQPRAASVPASPDDWFLQSRARGRVPRDPTHVEGWDWVDAAAGTLRLYGAACEAAMQDRGGLNLVAAHERCFE